ncbi:hypothetical protein [Gordonia alkanivorans]|uniref:hypothetical protein n=1 Tax=Gordonia alkanivorans TaxID=84096 RepID=UPI0005A6FA79|nr:hypothetical protein [Gordonia alkanivorans]
MADLANQAAWTAREADVDGLSVADAAAVFAGAPQRKSDSLDDVSVRANNLTSAAFAHVAVDAYARRIGQLDRESAHTTVRDLINDLHHYCDALGIDWGTVNDDSHYRDEVDGTI